MNGISALQEIVARGKMDGEKLLAVFEEILCGFAVGCMTHSQSSSRFKVWVTFH
jgi:hypothetical protein